MWPRFWKPFVIVIPSAATVLAVLYMTYRFIDPIPPRHFMIAAGMAASGYDNFARQYARILARDGVALEALAPSDCRPESYSSWPAAVFGSIHRKKKCRSGCSIVPSISVT
jgi:hypothetical protein